VNTRLPHATRWVIVGAGFAGASTAAWLAQGRQGPGIVLEREPTWGAHASGKNAALAKITETDPLVRALAIRSLDYFTRLDAGRGQLIARTGGLTVAHGEAAGEFAAVRDALRAAGRQAELVDAARVRQQVPLLAGVGFDVGIWCPEEGVVDIHALLTHYLRVARDGGFDVQTDCEVDEIVIEGGRVTSVHTMLGTIRCDGVIDATGAWAGRLGRIDALPLQPMRRHLFVSAAVAAELRRLPFTWVEDAGFYFRREGDGLLLSPCDETPSPPCSPPVDPAAAELLAEKLSRHAPELADLAIRRAWACLRTFAPDRRPVIGADPTVDGLFHVSGLGGFGMMTSAAVGEVAAGLLTGRPPDWIDVARLDPRRLAGTPGSGSQ
jgi:D-arginine dehydrogenase